MPRGSKEAAAGVQRWKHLCGPCRTDLSRKRGRPDWEGGPRPIARRGADRKGEKGRGILCQELWFFPPSFHVNFMFFFSGTRIH